MHEQNQDAEADRPSDPNPIPAGPAPLPPDTLPAVIDPETGAHARIEVASDPTSAPPAPLNENGLLVWLILIVVLGAGGLLLGQQELAALVALAGLFVAAQAADMDIRWQPLYFALGWLVPIGGVTTFISLLIIVRDGPRAEPVRTSMMVLCGLSAAMCLALAARPLANRVVRAMFSHEAPTHELRLVARLVLMGLMLAIPGWYAMRDTIEELLNGPESLLAQGAFGASLAGYVALALASVGFLIRRNLPQTLERLGITALGRRDAIAVVAGLALMVALNSGFEWVQRTWFPELWASDNAISQALARGLSIPQVLALGVTAGVGEEITIRGALQPKIGILLASLVFAALHVQYSWFGMLVIFTLGALLGIIRQRSSTGAAMIVHALYDMVAVFSI